MGYWRVLSAARSQRVQFEGCLAGSPAFLVGGHPLLLGLDLRLLRLPGVYVAAINNAAATFEPQLFISTDVVSCFNWNIFNNPRVMKMCNYGNHSTIISGKKLCHYPNTFFFDSDDKIMMSEFCRFEGPLPIWNSTFFTSLAILYQLGIKTIYLIGCVFNIDDGAYAGEQTLSEVELAYNKRAYSDIIDKMKLLAPMLRDDGMEIFTCHENTSLDGICDYISFEDAVSRVVLQSTSVEFNELKHITNAK